MTITNETWAAARSSDWRLTGRGRRQLAAVAVVVIAAMVVGALAPISGLTQIRVGVYVTSIETEPARHEYTVGLLLDNHGWFDEHVRTIDLIEAHQRIVALTPRAAIVPAGGRRHVSLTVRVTSCRGELPSDFFLVLRLKRFWGTLSDEQPLPAVTMYPDGSDGSPDFHTATGENMFMDGPAATTCRG